MNEDDTFRRLKRITFEDMRRQIIDINRTTQYPKRVPMRAEALEKGGWSMREFALARIEAANRLSSQD